MRQVENAEFEPEADRADGCAHPRDVHTLVGHQDAEARFLQAYRAGRLHHAWLLTGPKGIGKATLAYRMARFMLGGTSLLESSLDVPASDPVSQRISALGHGNLFRLVRPWDRKSKRHKTEIPVDAVRQLGGFFRETASEENAWRVCIVDAADELNRNSENAILKMLEEPPKKTLFILVSSAPGRLLPTIRSRCMQLDLRPVPEAELRAWVQAETGRSGDIVDAAVKLSRGAPGKALALMQNADDVLKPLARYIDSLGRSDIGTDMSIARALANPKAATARSLFWDALQDTVQAQAKYAATGTYDGPFKPAAVSKNPAIWEAQWQALQVNQRTEAAINLDKTANMLDTLSGVRSA